MKGFSENKSRRTTSSPQFILGRLKSSGNLPGLSSNDSSYTVQWYIILSFFVRFTNEEFTNGASLVGQFIWKDVCEFPGTVLNC